MTASKNYFCTIDFRLLTTDYRLKTTPLPVVLFRVGLPLC